MGSTQRLFGLVLVAFGAGLIALAPLLRWWVAPAVLAAPLDAYAVSVLQAQDATYTDLASGEKRAGKTLTATTTLRGDVPAGTEQTAVYDVYTQLVDGPAAVPGDGSGIVSTRQERLAADRQTATLSPCCGANVAGVNVGHTGLQHRFPPGTQRQSYDYFDSTTGVSHPAKYVKQLRITGMPAVEGLTLYQFTQVIGDTAVGSRDVPAKLLGADGDGQKSAERHYSVTRDLFVEPTSGVIVRAVEDVYMGLREPGKDTDAVTEVRGTFASTNDSIAAAAGAAREYIADEQRLTGTTPVGAVVFGVAVLGVGMVLFWRVDVPATTRSRRVARQREPAWV